MRIIRVFPRRTKATPTDELAYVGPPDLFAQADQVQISVTFTWDLNQAGRLAEQWERIAPVTIGGPATGMRGAVFTPGQFLKPGYIITSRGCPNHCWFCSVWRRDGPVRELPITEGWNILDDNLLACSESHIRAVFAMLARQPQRAQFTGGLEAARLEDWHVNLLASLKPRPSIFFAFDTPDDEEPLRIAAAKMHAAGFTARSHHLRAYVLIGYPKDTIQAAQCRLLTVLNMGITPMAMLYRSENRPQPTNQWRQFQRSWARPAAIHSGFVLS